MLFDESPLCSHMENTSRKTGGELDIVDNADDEWKGGRYLHNWCDIARGPCQIK